MLEVCIDSLESAINAINGGADELEICSSLAEGGLTPSHGLVKSIQDRFPSIKKNVMIRCRRGFDFVYNELEMEVMLSDIKNFKNDSTIKIDSFVYGALTEDRTLDINSCSKILAEANPINCHLHRAIDVCKNIPDEVTNAINLGFKRILTSGGCPNVKNVKSHQMIRSMIDKSIDKIDIMPGSGVCIENVGILKDLGVRLFHASCSVPVQLNVDSNIDAANILMVTDENKVRELKNKILNLF